MSEKKIYEITQMLQNKSNIENDFTDAMNMVTGMFKDKYINRLDDAFHTCHTNCCKNPSKEVRLINSLKPFLPPEKYENIDKLSETLLLMQTYQNIQKEMESHVKNYEYQPVTQSTVSATSYTPPENAIHDDGIYEVDSNCIIRQKGGNNFFSVLLAAYLCQQ